MNKLDAEDGFLENLLGIVVTVIFIVWGMWVLFQVY